MMEIWQDGVEWEYIGREYPRNGVYAIRDSKLTQVWTGEDRELIFRPKPKRYTAYGVVWEETGEVRPSTDTDAWWGEGTKTVYFGEVPTPRIILRPVAIEEK
jgi:hypothetical protein